MILNCFDMRRPELSLRQICEEVGLNKSTAVGILNTLLKYNYVMKNPQNGLYMLGQALAHKSAMVSNQLGSKLSVAGLKYMRFITEKYGVTSYLFAYENRMLSCVEMLIPSNSTGAVSTVLGRKMAYHAAASGKVVLAHFGEVELERHLRVNPLFPFTPHTMTKPELVYADIRKTRERGYSAEFDEVDEGVSALAVPIHSGEKLAGTFSVSSTTAWILENEEALVSELKNGAQLIANQL